jgi:hypothetical protein
MHIDSYQFGKIVINGKAYSSDCLIISDSVQPNWWRKQGHLLTADDLKSIIAVKPSILVVGCGASGMMKISESIEHVMNEHGIEMFAANTHKAVAKFNELVGKGQNVAGAMHLTC